MRLDKLEVGMVIKNYKELCEVLDVKHHLGGNVRKKQLEWIEQHIRYKKQGHTFIIKEILKTEVEPMIDARKNGNNRIPYKDLLEKIILDLMLYDNKDNKIFLSKTKIFRELNMVNCNYGIGKFNISKLSSISNIDKRVTEDWYNSTDAMLEGNLVGTLESLESKGIITWSKVITVDVEIVVNEFLVKSNDIKYNIDEEEIPNYDMVQQTVREHREATKEEELIIIRAEKDILQFMNHKDKGKVIAKGDWEEFMNKVLNLVGKEVDINDYYNSYKILLHYGLKQKRIDEIKKTVVGNIERDTDKDELNQYINKRVLDNAKKRHKKAIEYFGINRNHRAESTYIFDSDKLNDILLKKSALNISYKLRVNYNK